MRIDGYYWVKHPRYGWHVGVLKYGLWFLCIGDSSDVYSDKDFDQISSRIKNPDEESGVCFTVESSDSGATGQSLKITKNR